MTKEMLKNFKTMYSTIDCDIFEKVAAVSMSLALDVIKEVREDMVYKFLMQNNCYDTEAEKGLIEYLKEPTPYINNEVHRLINE